MIWIDLSESIENRGSTYKQERVQLRTELATLQKKDTNLDTKEAIATESESPADESIVDLTDQSSDSAKGPIADESEQITCGKNSE